MSTNPVGKRLKTDTYYADVEVSDIKATPSSSVVKSKVTASVDIVNTSLAVFTEDIVLPSIFDNLDILTAKDLLNFRRVNRCWRDAATSVLLKRNMCQISLDYGLVAYDDEDHTVAEHHLWKMGSGRRRESFSYCINYDDKFFNVYQPRRFLPHLSQVISTSLKFPSTSICFSERCSNGVRDLASPTADLKEMDHNQNDLLRFLSLYGKKITKLCFSDCISKKAVHNLLYFHMPHLVCLDFRCFNKFSIEDGDEEKDCGEFQVILPLPSTLEIKEIILGYTSHLLKNEYDFVKELFRVCPNLSSIKNVNVSSLGYLLEMGKCHLIKSMLFQLTFLIVPLFREVLEQNLLNLKLSKLSVELNDTNGYGGAFYSISLKFLNLILSTSKNSLNDLKLNLSQSHHHQTIFIPPLPHLKCLTLSDHDDSSSNTQIHFLGDVIGEAIVAGDLTAGAFVDDFVALASHYQENSNIPVDYFPRLCKVSLEMGETKNNSSASESNKMMGFFSVEHLLPKGVTTIPGDALETVNTLEITACPRYGRSLSKLFPNVSHLKIRCESICDLQNWVWTAFPKLETFQIHEQGDVNRNIHAVDSFFTGISQELCAKLDRRDPFFHELKSGRAHVLERTQPYIGNCENLKEFIINFEEILISKFASKVTAARGFSKVAHWAKIIFTFKSFGLSNDEYQEICEHLDSVKEFLEIQIL